MNRNIFITLFIGAHICFISLQIHKHTLFIKESFAKQKAEKEKYILESRLQQVTQELHALRKPSNIEKYAQALNMKPVQLNQIKRIKKDDKPI